jgi:uncharacterized protein
MLDGSATVQARLDPRAPFVLDVRELGRRPGTMRRLTTTVPAPPGLGIDVVGVPEGSAVELDARLESVQDGVLVTATVRAPLAGECARCLDPLDQVVDVDVQELFVYDTSELDAVDDEEVPVLEGDLLDLEPAVRDAVVLTLPVAPLCREDCPGLCSECGARLADEPGHQHEVTDPRWSALQALDVEQTTAGETPPEKEES